MSDCETIRRPQATLEDVRKILLTQYSLTAIQVQELASYNCRNFHVKAVDGITPTSGKTHDLDTAAFHGEPETSATLEKLTNAGTAKETEEYILKILNNHLSSPEILEKVRQQMKCAKHLRSEGFQCPAVINTKHGDIFALCGVDGDEENNCHAILLKYIPGQQLGKNTSLVTPEVLVELGIFLAKLHESLKTSETKELEVCDEDLWALENMHLLKVYLPYVQNERKRVVLLDILDKFEAVRNSEKFGCQAKGIIHGDFHDYNIIIDEASNATRDLSETSRTVTLAFTQNLQSPSSSVQSFIKSVVEKYGIIDFEDMRNSYPALELCRLIADLMSDCPHIEMQSIGGHVIAGYLLINAEPVRQFSFFYETILASLAQYVVLSAYEYQAQEGENDYLLLGSSEAWHVIQQLKNVEAKSLYGIWNSILSSYGIKDPLKI
ncbi:hydroxylysine kinase-like [Pomacea canaliculata]|uniref:hydroxylysine kinase-like n=1 Tax=Pomacea canaliculata TaxID=400727 RepID=UPI000D7396EE|nr:hydroxylysine kinase-like [Pomacea canaliculata]